MRTKNGQRKFHVDDHFGSSAAGRKSLQDKQ
jgi:hypothetical protein